MVLSFPTCSQQRKVPLKSCSGALWFRPNRLIHFTLATHCYSLKQIQTHSLRLGFWSSAQSNSTRSMEKRRRWFHIRLNSWGRCTQLSSRQTFRESWARLRNRWIHDRRRTRWRTCSRNSGLSFVIWILQSKISLKRRYDSKFEAYCLSYTPLASELLASRSSLGVSLGVIFLLNGS